MSQARIWGAIRMAAGLLLLAAFAVARQAVAQPPADSAATDLSAEQLRARLATQKQRLSDLEAQIRAGAVQPADAAEPKPLDDAAVKKIVEGYLKDNPGAGVPAGVQTGFAVGQGFYMRSAPDPKWANWDDQSKIPFELRLHGLLQTRYVYYKPTDLTNHFTNAPANGGANSSPDFSQLEIERGRLLFEGNLFDPNLRFRIDVEANTRGQIATAGGALPGTTGLTSIVGVPGGNQLATVDHGARLQGAFIAYDMHPCGYEPGCGPDCPDGNYRYTPTVTAWFGKFKPFIGLEETLLPFSEQFVEWSMASWFFDADDDAWQMEAGFQVRAVDDRLFGVAYLTNGNEAATANNLQLDDLPGFNGGFWYDFGGTWNDARKRWDLFGNTIADIDYSCNPVVRVGGAVNLVPMDRRSEFSNVELGKIRVMPGAPGGTTLLNMLNGGGFNPNAAGVAQFAVDAADCYTYNAFVAGKWHGFSLYSDWWLHDIDNFRGRRFPAGAYPGNGVNQPILYSVNNPGSNALTNIALFPHHALLDYGMDLQAGYFIIPKKLEIAGRWAWIRGESGNIRGNETFTTLTPAQTAALGIPAAAGPVRVYNEAFREFSETQEYAVGLNYYFYRELVKWQTDFGVYTGAGNPAVGGQSAAGFIPGVDGWMIRSQIQIGF
jgi:hypothetical protein